MFAGPCIWSWRSPAKALLGKAACVVSSPRYLAVNLTIKFKSMAVFTTKPGEYLNKLPQGNTRLRVLSKQDVSGYEMWIDVEVEGRDEPVPKPIRKKGIMELPLPSEGKPFNAVIVWNYEEEACQIWFVRQPSILNQISTYEHTPSWGDVTGYDIIVNRKGTSKVDTKYQVMPESKTPLSQEIKDAVKDIHIDLEQLYATDENPHGGDPFAQPEQTTKERVAQAQADNAKQVEVVLDKPKPEVDPEDLPL